MSLWVEPFAGSLAVGLRALGHRHLVGWQGGKQGYAARILELAGNPKPSEVWCADVTEWATVWRALAKDGAADEARAWLAALRERERPPHCREGHPQLLRSIWLELRDHWQEHGIAETGEGAARWLALVKGSVLSRGPVAGCRVSPGHLNWRKVLSGPSMGQPRTETLGAVVPPCTLPLRVWDNAHAIPPTGGAIVYLDPPYVGTTGYARDVPFSVPDLVADWTRAGSTVLVSEAVPMFGSAVVYDLTGHRKASPRMMGATPELLTVYLPQRRRRRI